LSRVGVRSTRKCCRCVAWIRAGCLTKSFFSLATLYKSARTTVPQGLVEIAEA
jgi:hypothetical protein